MALPLLIAIKLKQRLNINNKKYKSFKTFSFKTFNKVLKKAKKFANSIKNYVTLKIIKLLLYFLKAAFIKNKIIKRKVINLLALLLLLLFLPLKVNLNKVFKRLVNIKNKLNIKLKFIILTTAALIKRT